MLSPVALVVLYLDPNLLEMPAAVAFWVLDAPGARSFVRAFTLKENQG